MGLLCRNAQIVKPRVVKCGKALTLLPYAVHVHRHGDQGEAGEGRDEREGEGAIHI